MRALAMAVLCFSSSLVNAIPVTYLFSGQTTSLSVTHGGQQYNDPNSPLVLNGIEVYNGDSAITGSITIDFELMDHTSPGNAAQNRFYGQVLNWQVVTEGQTYSSFGYAPGAPQTVHYFDDRVVTFDEIPDTTGPLNPDVSYLTFNFSPGYLTEGVPSELPVGAFIDGIVHFGAMVNHSDLGQAAYGSLIGSITHLYRASEVPEPATASLLLVGLAGIIGSRFRRRQPQSA